MATASMTTIKSSQIAGSDTQALKYLIVPIFIFFALLIFAIIRGPQIISGSGIGTAIMVSTPLILATYALTALALSGRVTVDLSMGPLIGFINVTTIQLYGAGYIQSPVSYFVCAFAIGIIYQILYALIVLFVRVQPIIIALSMFLAFSGINLVILPRPGGRAPEWMSSWSSGTEVIQPTLILLVFATLAWYALTHTAFWQHLKLMGSDEKSAYTSGVRIYLVRIGAHIIGGIYAALAAIAFTGLIGSGDPTQGTTYTLMAITALVLGGSSLVGGRGGAFGAILGALNIYLINFILSTFRFESLQSFVTDLSYGAVLVASLLILIALPYIQKAFKKLSVFVFFIIGTLSATAVLIHMKFDQVTRGTVGGFGGKSRKAEMFEEALASGSDCLITGKACSEGGDSTIWMFIAIGIAALIYLVSLLIKHRDASTVSFIIASIVIFFGCVFSGTRIANFVHHDLGSNLQYILNYAPQYFASEYLKIGPALPDFTSSGWLVGLAYAITMLAGIIFFTSAIVVIALPKFRKEIKTQTLILFAIVSSVIIFSAVTYYGVDANRESFFGIDGYAVILICFLLFLLTTPTLFSQINLSNVFIVFIGLMSLVAIYFLASPSGIIISDDGTKFFEPIITELGIIDTSSITYQRPIRGEYIPENTTLLKEIALTVFAIFVFQFFTYLTMRGQMSYKKLRPYIPILSIGAITWSALFYGIGFPYWKIILIASIGILTAPLVWQAFNVYRVKLKSEEGLEKWGGLSDDRQN
ncbi:ABC transporter permease [Alphaproteobacteria bacterium]|nr:ABC transporter permease [Alphaproteobacteria bacterium]